jgi:hypothetical protein
MRQLYFILMVAVLVGGSSCLRDGYGDNRAESSKEVEISISTSGQTPKTRAPLDGLTTDTGSNDERTIATLDLLVFDDSGYLYRREAYKLSTGVDTYRVMLKESSKSLDVYLFANVRDILKTWETTDRTGLSWSAVQTQLIDTNPARLVGQDEFTPLPMFGSKLGQKIDPTKAPTKWGDVNMVRSVASSDLYVAQTDATANFHLTGLLVWYAADKGYLPGIEVPETTPKQYVNPADMQTTLNGVVEPTPLMHADGVSNYQILEGEDTNTYDGVAYQMYFYGNGALNTTDKAHRPTRIIVAGKYKNEAGEWEETYYPIDIVNADGTYRPVVRNWKYEFKVTSVNGPGYDTPQEAAEGAEVNLNVKVIPWDKDDVEIGVKGHYYAAIDTKSVILWRDAGSTQQVNLTYEVLDDDPVTFDFDFADDTEWGTQVDTPETSTIENDYFTVKMTHTPGTGGGTVLFDVTAKQAMAESDKPRLEYLTVKMRDLVFTIDITQLNSSEHDWDDGGDIPSQL